MFTKTIKFSDLKNTSEFSEMTDDQIYQIFHRGSGVKVLMTQEKFFNLISKIDRLEAAISHSQESQMGNEGLDLKELKKDIEGIKDMLSLTHNPKNRPNKRSSKK